MTLSDDWAADKALQQKNSDGKNAWSTDHDEPAQTQAPPAVEDVHLALPVLPAERLPDDGTGLTYRGYAIRQKHVYFDGSDYLS